MEWQDIETAPKDETTFLAALLVHNSLTNADHWEYALMWYGAGQFGFVDNADTGWDADDYTHWAPIAPPPKPE